VGLAKEPPGASRRKTRSFNHERYLAFAALASFILEACGHREGLAQQPKARGASAEKDNPPPALRAWVIRYYLG
jgi:hypothetical protein